MHFLIFLNSLLSWIIRILFLLKKGDIICIFKELYGSYKIENLYGGVFSIISECFFEVIRVLKGACHGVIKKVWS